MTCQNCKCKDCNQKYSEWLDISDVIPNTEVEIKVHDKNKSWNDLKLSDREDELLTYDDCIKLSNSKYAKILKMDGSSIEDDFHIQQPFELNKKNGYVARFDAGSDWADMDCDRYPFSFGASLGVRFKRVKK